MKYAVVIRNLTDLRAGPNFCSERKSQLLFNEPVAVGSERSGYRRVSQPDGYSGWVDEKALYSVSPKDFTLYTKRFNCQIITKTARVTPVQRGQFPCPPFLYYGTRMFLRGRQGNSGIVILPGDRPALISLRKLIRFSKQKRSTVQPRFIIKEARKFLGTPYLWGGCSPYGFDCSGLVQSVFRTAGVYLPRDSKDQRKIGAKVSREDIRPGDLLHFEGHVAIALDRYRIIHASLGEGGVAINSLNPRDSGFRKDLYDSFIIARRVVT